MPVKSRSQKATISQREAVASIHPYELANQDPALLKDPSEVTRAKDRVRQRIRQAVKMGTLKELRGRRRVFDREAFAYWARNEWPGVDGRPGPGERAFAPQRNLVVTASVPTPRLSSQARMRFLPFSLEGMSTARALIAELEQRIRDLEGRCAHVERERDDLATEREAEREVWSKREAELLAELEKRAPPRVNRRLRGETQRKRS